jgi:hypothetical protein
VSRLVGIFVGLLSHHVPAKGGQAAILIDSTKFLKNRESFFHSGDFRWVDGTTQELLKEKKRIVRSSNLKESIRVFQTLTSSCSRVDFTVRQILSSETRRISGRGNCSILRSRPRVYSL